jgi:membrane associated rhomboid family serine protease
MPAAKRANDPLPLLRAHVSLALMGVAVVGVLASAILDSGAIARRDAVFERAELYYREHPYLNAPMEIVLAVAADDAPTFAASSLDAESVAREQAELDTIVAEAETAAHGTAIYQVGVTGGSASPLRFAVHALVHAGWLHLLWNLALLGSVGARLELRLGRARYAGVLFGGGLAGAVVHAAASAPEAAPLVGLSAATAALFGALAISPGDVATDPLALGPTQRKRSSLRSAAIAGALACAAAAGVGVSAPSFAPAAQLGGFALGALAMFGFARAGFVVDPAEAKLAPPLERALALLRAGDATGALAALRAHLEGGADDALAVRALGLAVRGRGDAPEALARALLGAISRKQRGVAIAAWRELAAIGARPRDASAALRTLSAWLRAAGAVGEARAAAIASLEGADPALVIQQAKEARRGDPVFALRAAECALAAPTLSALERKAMQELLAQAQRDAQGAGVIVLDAAREAEAAATRRAAAPPPAERPPRHAPSQALEPSDDGAMRADDGALDLDALVGADPEPPATPELTEPEPQLASADSEAEPPDPQAQNEAFFERGAVDLTDPGLEASALPDPAVAGEGALLDALHEALASDGAELGAELVADEPLGMETLAAEEAPDLHDDGEAPVELAPPRVPLAEPAPPPAPRAAAPAKLPLAPAAAPAPSADDFAFGEAADALYADEKPEPAPPPLRALHVSAAVPERFGSEALVLAIEGRGRAKLAYGKIDAVAAAGVRGLSQNGKAVLLIDLVIGFTANGGELRVVRLRADAFDPRSLTPGHTSPLAALRAVVAELRARTRAVALPPESAPNAPFRIYADLASYEREALGAERS